MIYSTWNVQGLSRKTNEVMSELKYAKIDIAVITETKKKGNGSENWGYYDHFYSGVPKDQRAQQGISIVIRRTLRKYITSWEAINQRFIKMNLTIKGYRVTILGVYGVNNDAIVNIKDDFFEQLNDEITKIGTSREIIILGDLNCRTGRENNNVVVGRHGEETRNENGTRLISICEQNNLKILNGFYQHRNIHKYTWTQSTRNLKSVIDYAITRQNTKINIQDVKACRGPSCGSDHYVLKMKAVLPSRNEQQVDKQPNQNMKQIRYNLDSLDHESVRELFRKRLDGYLGSNSFTNTEDHYEHIEKSIHAAAEEALGKYDENQQRRKPYWWDEEIEKEIAEKRQKYHKFLTTNSDIDKINYKEAQAKVRKRITQKKNEAWEKNCNKINTYIGGRRSTESWKLIKKLREQKKKEIISPITNEKWEQYFKDLLTENRTEFTNKENNVIEINVESSPFRVTRKEVTDICRSLKNGKSPGPGDIPAELIKIGTEKLYDHLRKLFQSCLNGAEIPKEWKISIMSTIHKKGRKDQCENYRGIAVTSTISRIYGKIIKNKIENEYKDFEAEEQAGFRAGRSTIDHLYCVTQVIEKKNAVNQEIHLLYVDLQKAYDSVPLNKLWTILEQTNINNGLIKAVKKLYTNSTTKIRVGKTITEGFNITKGLKQGCCISPTLFKIYLEQALKIWKRKCNGMGIPLNDNTTLFTLCFADDQIVIAQDHEDLSYMTRKLIEEYTKWGLEVNVTKTECMCIGGTPQNIALEDGGEIKHCEEYKYLGLKITRNGTLDTAIKDRNTQGRKAIAMMNGILWDQTISKTNKQLIYNIILKSIMTYSSEVWQIKQSTEKMLITTEMDFWRRSAGRSRRDRVRNDRIREIMGVRKTITDDIKTKQLIWYGHVQRMTEDRLPKQILTWAPHGRRRRGRPRRSWREGIDKEMEEREIPEDLWRDREGWRLGVGRRRRTL